MLITAAVSLIIAQCAKSIGIAIPITTKNPVKNLPKSTTPLPPDSIKSS